jgi:undecaprenyl-diphosphatase
MRWLSKTWDKRPDLAELELIGVASVAGAIWTFLKLADRMEDGTLERFDERVLLAFRPGDDLTNPIGPEWVEVAVRDVTALGGSSVLSLVTLSVIGYLFLTRRWRTAAFVLAAVVSGGGINLWLKESYARDRPALVPDIGPTYSASFPSGHTMMSTVTYMSLAALLARTQEKRRVRAYLVGVATLMSVMIGISRVYLAVHWPSDVLAGWAAGSVWALLGWSILRWLQRHRLAEEPGEEGLDLDDD